ncbi:hypothetical protein QFZ42_004149 [Variovorax paradoxus]|uniref:hypothetical protein n=1 Tax=Variovorax paradoxus TaxID=34073 RepID=UPI00278FB2A4|nr:hypothetical protein [Variovorax paradoxus]MDQ0572315.1 hypothetical protein [Variovorax paradoxus]
MTSDEETRRRLAWLVKTGYVLTAAGTLLLVLFGFLLPVELLRGPHHYYRVVPSDHGWIITGTLTGFGVVLVLIGRMLRTKGR